MKSVAATMSSITREISSEIPQDIHWSLLKHKKIAGLAAKVLTEPFENCQIDTLRPTSSKPRKRTREYASRLVDIIVRYPTSI